MQARSRRSCKLLPLHDQVITSVANAKVKHARSLSLKKNRAVHRQFAVEGTRILEEAERAGLIPALVFYEPQAVAANARAGGLLKRLQASTSEVHAITPQVLGALAQTDAPQGLIAIYPFPDLPLPPSLEFALILDALRDPGNVGTVLRTAWAVGVDAVLLAPGTADPYNPKVVRAAMGAHFLLPIASLSWEEIARALKPIPRVYLADAHGAQIYTWADWATPLALILGREAEGASAEAQRLATARVSIPMPGRVESLNVAVAAGILLFEAIKPRS
jgi:TrmH family RNA methyltransferase